MSKLENTLNGISKRFNIAEGSVTEREVNVPDNFQNETERHETGDNWSQRQ